jgi:hypothetical protein
MNILAALRQEEAKWKKQVSAAQQQLDTVQAAMKLLGGMNGNKTTVRRRKKKSVMSAATKAKIAKAAKERWAKIRAAKKG